MLSTEQTTLFQQRLKDLFWLLLGFGIFYAIWIGSHALFTPDEGRYSEVAREMVATGDYITPRLNGVAFLDKPALYYWLQASAIQLFGLKESALRCWPALMGVLGALITYLAGSIIFNRRTGIISALILATCPLYYGAAHYANLDLEVAVLISNSLLFFLIGIQFPSSKTRTTFLMLAYIFAGLAFLTKGLIGIVFPALIIGSWILLLNRWKLLTKIHLLSGFALFCMIVIPWYVSVQRANPEFLHFFFVTQQLARFLTKGDYNSKAAAWFYLPIVLAGIFPWCVFVFQSITKQIQFIWQDKQKNSNALFLILWLFIVFIFFSIPKSKTVGYILPIFPAIALLIGRYLDLEWHKIKSHWGMLFFFLLIAGLSIGFYSAAVFHFSFVNPDIQPYLYIGSGLFFISFVTSIVAYKKGNTLYLFNTLLGTAMGFLLLITASTPAINQRSIKPLTQELNSILKPGDEVATYYKFYYDLPIYTGKRITIVADWHANDIIHNDNWLREMWFGMPFQDTTAWLIEKNEFWKRWNSKKHVYVVTDVSYYDKIKKLHQKKVYLIAQYKNTVLLSNNPMLEISKTY